MRTKDAFAVGAAAVDLPAAAGALCVQASSVASQAAGGLVTTGTLTETAAGSRQFSYQATPTNQLRIAYGDGTTTVFTITTLQSQTSTFDAFFDQNFSLVFHMTRAGAADIQVSQGRNNGTLTASASGTFTSNGVVYTAQGTSTGTVTAAVDPGYAETTSESTTLGSVTATGFNMTLGEYRFSHTLVYNGTTTQNYQRHSSSSWTQGGDSYAFVNGRVHRAYVNLRPGDASYWLADGTLQFNGQQVGGLSMTNNGTLVSVVLTVNGEQEVMEQYPAQ